MAAILRHLKLFELGNKQCIGRQVPDPYIRMPEVGMIRGALKLVLLIALNITQLVQTFCYGTSASFILPC